MRWIETEETVRFNEVDEWGMVWYGHYMAWFEVGRMALLRRFDLLPRHMVDLGYIAPVVSLTCDYKQSVGCGESIVIRTTAIKPEITALICKFEIMLKNSKVLLARGETMQVLMTVDRKLVYRLSGEIEKRMSNLLQFCQT